MNKAELISSMSKKLDVSYRVADEALDVLLETISEELVKGEKIKFVDFGSFEKVKRAARKGHNPHTGEVFDIPACYEPVFRPGKALKEIVNK